LQGCPELPANDFYPLRHPASIGRSLGAFLTQVPYRPSWPVQGQRLSPVCGWSGMHGAADPGHRRTGFKFQLHDHHDARAALKVIFCAG
jgi:hypothetical protein